MNVRTLALVALAASALAVGCTGKDSGDSAEECTNSVTDTFPAADSTSAYYRTVIEVTFEEAEESASVTVTGPSGEVQGTVAWRGNVLVFTPNAPLAPNADYTVAIDFSCGNPEVSWHTSEVGAASTPEDLVGNAYVLDLASARFVEPPNVGALLQNYLTTNIILGVTTATATEVEFAGAIGVEDSDPVVQDVCNPTIEFPEPADFSNNPYFEIGPATTTIDVEDFSVTIQNLFIGGAFAPDGSYLAGAVLEGKVDTRPLVPLVGNEDDPPETICNLAAQVQAECVECGEPDPGVYCLVLKVDSIQATAIDDSLVIIPDQETACLNEECAADPDCTADTGD